MLNTSQFLIILTASFLFVDLGRATPPVQTIRLASDPWCPFYCTKSQKQGPGVLVEILEEALKNSHFKTELKEINWARAVEMAKQGELHGVIGAYKDDIPGFIMTRHPQMKSRDCYFSLGQKNWAYQGFQSLKGMKVGIINGYAYGDSLEAFKSTAEGKMIFQEVTGENPLAQNLKKLKSGRIDLILENEMVMNFNLLENSISKEVVNLGCGEEVGVYILFNPKNIVNKDVVALLEKYQSSKEGKKEIRRIADKYLY